MLETDTLGVQRAHVVCIRVQIIDIGIRCNRLMIIWEISGMSWKGLIPTMRRSSSRSGKFSIR